MGRQQDDTLPLVVQLGLGTSALTEEGKKEVARIAARQRKRAQRAKRAMALGGTPVFVQIELTAEEYAEFVQLQDQSRDPQSFRKAALLRGAKFVANTGRGRDKIKGG